LRKIVINQIGKKKPIPRRSETTTPGLGAVKKNQRRPSTVRCVSPEIRGGGYHKLKEGNPEFFDVPLSW